MTTSEEGIGGFSQHILEILLSAFSENIGSVGNDHIHCFAISFAYKMVLMGLKNCLLAFALK